MGVLLEPIPRGFQLLLQEGNRSCEPCCPAAFMSAGGELGAQQRYKGSQEPGEGRPQERVHHGGSCLKYRVGKAEGRGNISLPLLGHSLNSASSAAQLSFYPHSWISKLG